MNSGYLNKTSIILLSCTIQNITCRFDNTVGLDQTANIMYIILVYYYK